MNLKSLISAFKTSEVQLTDFNDRDDDIVKGIVSRLSEGSITLQSSQYITEADINKRADKVFGHNFCK